MSNYTFAGDHMTITEDEHGTAHITFDDVGTGRRCGSCTLCCKLLPIPLLHKPAGTRCTYSRVSKGCTIYADRPSPCRAWSCRWLSDPDTAELRRPDNGHYVVDMSYDVVRTVLDGDVVREHPVMQVWVDPAFPDAYHARELRAYMARRMEKHGLATIVRFSSTKAVVVVPPPISSDGKWLEIKPNINPKLPDRETFHRSAMEVTTEP